MTNQRQTFIAVPRCSKAGVTNVDSIYDSILKPDPDLRRERKKKKSCFLSCMETGESCSCGGPVEKATGAGCTPDPAVTSLPQTQDKHFITTDRVKCVSD